MLFSSRVSALLQKIRACFDFRGHPRNMILIHGMNYAPEIIGVGKYTGELATFLAGQGHEIEVVTALPHYPSWRVKTGWVRRGVVRREAGMRITHGPLILRSGRVGRLLAPVSFALLAAPVVIWRALWGRPRTVVCIEPTLFAAPASLLAAWLVGARTVLHVQDLEADAAFATGYLSRAGLLLWAARRFERAMRSRFDVVITISDAMADRLRHQGVAAPIVLRNWVRADFRDRTEDVSDIRERLGIPPGCKLALYAGNLGLKQGMPVLIEAARHLRADPTIHLLVIGDGAMAGSVRAAAAGLPNLTWTGLLPDDQFGALLAGSDLHILPQDRRASDLVFPSKLGGLLKSGKPILVTADPTSELALWLGSAALRCPPGDGRAFALAIDAALHGAVRMPDRVRAEALLATLGSEIVLPEFARCIAPTGWGTQADGGLAPEALAPQAIPALA